MRRLTIVVIGAALLIAGAISGVIFEDVRAQTAPLPPGHPPAEGMTPGQPLPPGHPPGGSPPSIPGPPDGSGSGAQSLTWAAPSSWTKETPSSQMRRAQYKISGPGGPAECVVFYFGPGQGGDATANVERWASQFTTPDGKPVGKGYKRRDFKVGDLSVSMVEVTGTYVGGMGGPSSGGDKPNSMLLGAVVQGPDANWFFRAIGPRSTLEKERGPFEKMIRSVKRGGSNA
jgi:hypothetical protein